MERKKKAMLANVKEDFALEVIDPAVVQEQRDSPDRKFIVSVGVLIGLLLGVFMIFFFSIFKKYKVIKFMSSSFSKISIVGLGYVGLPLSLQFARWE